MLALKDGGEEATKRPRKLRITVSDAVRESLAANRTVSQARLAAAIALANEREARAGLLPALFLAGAYSKRDSTPTVVTPTVTFITGPREVASYALSLDFPVFAFGKYIHAYSAAKFARRGAEADSAAAESVTTATLEFRLFAGVRIRLFMSGDYRHT